MAFLNEEKKENHTSLANQRNTQDATPRKKKKLCIGFGNKMKKQQLPDTSKNIISANGEEQVMHHQKSISSKENTFQLHEDIDEFLEKIENARYQENMSQFEKRLEQELGIPVERGMNRGQEPWNIEENREELRNEVETRNRLLDDLEQQMLERQVQLIQKTEIITRLKKELDLRDQSLNALQKEFEKKAEQARTFQQEIMQRDRIIQDIKGQLVEKQTWIVENNHFTEQLSRELEQNTRRLKKVQEELQKRKVRKIHGGHKYRYTRSRAANIPSLPC